jgi:hypothetical protein
VYELQLIACLLLAGQSEAAPLATVAEFELPGRPARFDYQCLDEKAGRLFLSHMRDDHLVVVDVTSDSVIANLPGYKEVTGVLAVPEEDKLFASAAGTHEVIVADLHSFKILARLEGAEFPDGIAYAPEERRVFVSDESGGNDLVINAATNQVVGKVELGGEAGNTHYDAAKHRILVAIQTKNEFAAINPKTLEVVHYPLQGSDHPHGFLINDERGVAYISCQGNSKLLVVDLASMKVIQMLSVGDEPDVLSFDSGLGLLYVGCESGIVNVYREQDSKLIDLGAFEAPHAHSVAVSQQTHRVYLPLQDVAGKPVMWVLEPAANLKLPPGADSGNRNSPIPR